MTNTFRSIVLGQIGLLIVAAALAAQPAVTPVPHELVLHSNLPEAGPILLWPATCTRWKERFA